MANQPTAKQLRKTPAPPARPRAKPRWRNRLREDEQAHKKMELVELLRTPQLASRLNFNNFSAVERVRSLSGSWASFYERATESEKEIAFPAVARFVDEVCELAGSSSNLSISKEMLESLRTLIPHEPFYLLNKFLNVSLFHSDENIRVFALACAESGFPYMVSTPENSYFHMMGQILDRYENEPGHLSRPTAEEFAKSASSFVFAHNEYLLASTQRGILAYGVAWGVGIETSKRVAFMERVADGDDNQLKTNLFSRVPSLVNMMPVRWKPKPNLPQGTVDKFPEAQRALEKHRILSATVELQERQRLVCAADKLLFDSGVQFVQPSTSVLQ
ncbi:hypothetical protein GF412_04630 [Candidatus Micrarchaeota archaeon]|nr:hypothetical protein [Candidatus Micrarchaeota archaeon]MBD3418238.1 hypothetical protein [Candidatus Micrarchaeota archaeon]